MLNISLDDCECTPSVPLSDCATSICAAILQRLIYLCAGADDDFRSAPARSEEPDEPPMWLMADTSGELLPEPTADQTQSPIGGPAQPSSNNGSAPPRPPEAALRMAVPGTLAAALRPYQRDGVRFLFRHAPDASACLPSAARDCGRVQCHAALPSVRGAMPSLPLLERTMLLTGSTLVATAGSSQMIWCVLPSRCGLQRSDITSSTCDHFYQFGSCTFSGARQDSANNCLHISAASPGKRSSARQQR